jgi:hypothetical protein
MLIFVGFPYSSPRLVKKKTPKLVRVEFMMLTAFTHSVIHSLKNIY